MQSYDTTVSKIKKQGRILLIKLDFSAGIEFNFIPGQFIMINYKDAQGDFKRSYSISSDPEHKNSLELCIALKEGGRGSAVLANTKEGDKFKLDGPFGVFCLEEIPNNDVILIAGGTGISPLRSMLKHLLNINFPNKVTLFYSFKSDADYLYKEEFEQLSKENKNFQLIPISTQPNPEWKGETQHVQEIFQKYIKGVENQDVYACGPVPMVDDIFNTLKGFGFREEHLHREKWTV